jgi:hypothetical protein
MRLQRKGPPDPAHRALAQAAALGHRARAPVRGVGRRTLQSQPHHPLNLRVADMPRGAWPQLVEQAVQPPFQKTLAPFADGLMGQPQLLGDSRVGLAGRACQHDARTLGQGLRALRPLQRLPLLHRQAQRCYRAPRPHGVLPPIRKTPADYNLFNALMTQDTSVMFRK